QASATAALYYNEIRVTAPFPPRPVERLTDNGSGTRPGDSDQHLAGNSQNPGGKNRRIGEFNTCKLYRQIRFQVRLNMNGIAVLIIFARASNIHHVLVFESGAES